MKKVNCHPSPRTFALGPGRCQEGAKKPCLCLRYLTCFMTMSLLLSVTTACPSKCYCVGVMVDCYDRELLTIPDTLPEDIIYLNLQRNQLTTISSLKLSRLSKLENILLNKNRIATLQSGSFVNISNLKQLDLSDNQISQIEPDSFQNLPKLKILSLKGNQLEEIDGYFTDLSSLERLDLSFNRLGTISNGTFSGLNNLTYLSLSGNRIPSIPNFAFASMTDLSYLFLSRNPLFNVDYIWHGLSNLFSLDISSCNLIKIPRALPASLRFLHLSNNSLSFIGDDELKQTGFLNNLFLDDNQISNIHESAFLHTPYMNKISIKNNRLRMLPSPIPANVSSFFADGNDIQRIFQFNFDHDSKMAVLSLKNNSIEAVAANTFSRMANLTALYLSNNKIKVMFQMAYSRLRQLRTLSLDSNPIQEVEKRALGGLLRLTRLGLSGISSKVKIFTDDMFRDVPSLINLDLQESPGLVAALLDNTKILEGLRSIKYLNLMRNKLTNLKTDLEMWLPKLRSIRLKGNPWLCDNNLLPLRRWMKRSPRKFRPITESVCQQPDALRGKPIISLSLNQFTPTPSPPPTTTSALSSTVPQSVTSTLGNKQSVSGLTTTSTLSKMFNTTTFNTMSLKTSTISSPTSTSRMQTKTTSESIATTIRSTPVSTSKSQKSSFISKQSPLIVTKSPRLSTVTTVSSSSVQTSSTNTNPQSAQSSHGKVSYAKTSENGISKSSTTSASSSQTTESKNNPRKTSIPGSSRLPTKTKSPTTPTITNSEFSSSSSMTSLNSESMTSSSGNDGIVKSSTTIPVIDTHPPTASSQDDTTPKQQSRSARLPTKKRPSYVTSTLSPKSTMTRDTTNAYHKVTINVDKFITISSSLKRAIKTKNTGAPKSNEGTSGHSNQLPDSGQSRLPAMSTSSKTDKTKTIIIGVSVSLSCIIIVAMVIAFIVRYKKQHKRDPIDHRYSNFAQSSESVSENLSMVNQIHGQDVQLGTQPQNSLNKTGNTACKAEPKSNTDSKGGNSRRGGSSSSNGNNAKFGMDCFSPRTQDDSEMLMYSWNDEPHPH